MRKRANIIAALFFISCSQTLANFDFEHADCKIRFKKGEESHLNKAAVAQLRKRQYIPEEMHDNRVLLPGDLYYYFEKRLEGGLYKRCIIRSYIKKAKSRLPQKNDPVIFKKEIKRSLPRVTFSGKERCLKAIKETFIHIPRCKKVGFAGEDR